MELLIDVITTYVQAAIGLGIFAAVMYTGYCVAWIFGFVGE